MANKRTAKKAQEKQDAEHGGTKFVGPLDQGGLDIQVSQNVINMYKQAMMQREKEFQTFTLKLIEDLNKLLDLVPDLKDNLKVYDDAYEVFDAEPDC